MTGIENICQAIRADAETRAQELLAQADAEANSIRAEFAERARAESEQAQKRGKAAAAEREERLHGVAQLELRKQELQVKQELIEEAFENAEKQLAELSGAEAVEFLAALAAKNAVRGDEEIILCRRDRDAYGAQVVEAANRLCSGHLTLSAESREFRGGVILRSGDTELNATLEAIIRMAREELSGQVAELLFH